ncbi:hypothetical protein BE08_04990 [Sorangium cellulosum]|uniref:asparagine synthase (glutamine-hydrolyzing) n=1 Tax=Sorangium cellulosum TaxID=56 RepID=A0A150PJR0_SORCE|nr:hypothetical protein BE08_04990 [Sorangium cellulosum]
MLGTHDGALHDGALIERMTAALRHRGPDGCGHAVRGSARVGATRLSVIDPAANPQPVYNETDQICVAFNGEIYNHRELRAELERKGHVFRTRTDTEVVVHLYEEMGDDCVRRLHGMFAFAILDGARLLLARDRLGIKPLHYVLLPEAQTFLFASEIKSILQHPSFTPRLDVQAFADSIALGFPVGDETFFEGVKSLLPGCTMVVTQGGERVHVEEPRRYYTLDFTRDDGMTFEEAERQMEAELERAVETHLAADVEVGLTLSGGLDSTVLALLASERLERPLLTFTVGDHEGYADVVQAGHVAKMVGSEHECHIVSFEEYLSAIPGLIAAEERPSSLHGMSSYLLCRRVAQRVKACLHGEGADEIFGGYRDYVSRESRLAVIRERLPLLKRLGVPPSARAIATIERISSARTSEDYLARIFEANMTDALERQHLAPVDRYSMASSLEMRVPYLDDGVFELAGRIPLSYLVRSDIGVRKYILRRFTLRRFGLQAVDIVLREKLGAPIAGLHLLDRFDTLCEETLPDDYLAKHELGFCFGAKRELLLFEMFIETFMKHRGDPGAVGSVRDFLNDRTTASAARRVS